MLDASTMCDVDDKFRESEAPSRKTSCAVRKNGHPTESIVIDVYCGATPFEVQVQEGYRPYEW